MYAIDIIPRDSSCDGVILANFLHFTTTILDCPRNDVKPTCIITGEKVDFHFAGECAVRRTNILFRTPGYSSDREFREENYPEQFAPRRYKHLISWFLSKNFRLYFIDQMRRPLTTESKDNQIRSRRCQRIIEHSQS